MISLWLLWLSHFILDLFTGLWPIYKTMSGIPLVLAGIIAGISGLIGELSQVFFGYIADKGKRKAIALIGLSLTTGMLWITKTTDPLTIFILLLFLMIGSGAYHPAAAGMAALFSEKKKGTSILFYASGGAFGMGISQLVFIHVFNKCSGSIFLLAIPLALIIFMLARHTFPTSCTAKRDFSIRHIASTLWRHKRALMPLYAAQVLVQTLWLASVFLLPDLLQEKGCSTWLCFGGGHLCIVLGSAAMMIPVGYICDKLGEKKMVLCFIAIATCFFYLLLFTPSLSPWMGGLLLTLLGASLGIVNPTIISWGSRLVPDSPSSVSALLMGCAWCLGNLGPLWGGWISSHITIAPVTTTLGWMGSLLVFLFLSLSITPQIVSEKTVQEV